MDLQANLENIGLNQREIKTYCTILELGEADIRTIGLKSELPRTSLYTVVERLVELGIVVTRTMRGKAIYSPAPASCFESLLASEQAELERKSQALSDLARQVQPYLAEQAVTIPRISVFEGRAQVERMLYDYLEEWRKSYERAGDYTLWGFQDHEFVTEYSKWHEHSWKSRGEREEIKLFSNSEAQQQQSEAGITKREIRRLPINVTLASTILIRGEFIINARTHGKLHSAVMTYDPVMAANMREIFRLLWDFTEEL